MEQLTRVQLNSKYYAGYKAIDIGVRIFVGLLLACIVMFVLFRPMVIAGDGMNPALANGDTVLVSRLAPLLTTPKRGEAVAYQRGDTVYVGRIIASEGEAVQMVNGYVYINGELLDERTYVEISVGNFSELTVGEGEVFVLCDNRALASEDSSSHLVKYDDLWGVIRVRIYPQLNIFGAS